MRFTTYYCNKGQRDLKSRWVPSTSVEIGDSIGHCLTQIGIPLRSAPWAFATCFIQVMGRDAHNDNGTALRSKGRRIPMLGQQRWVHTRLETGGAAPKRFQCRPNGRFAYADSFEGANTILECFGLDMDQVLDHFGNVADNERKVFDLVTIVLSLAPELLQIDSKIATA